MTRPPINRSRRPWGTPHTVDATTRGVVRHAGLALLLVAGPSLFSAGCGRAEVAGLDRETFVSVYVELRTAALSSPSGRITPGERERILEARGLGEDDLMAFVDLHGRDVAYMARIWTEVEERLQRLDGPADGAL